MMTEQDISWWLFDNFGSYESFHKRRTRDSDGIYMSYSISFRDIRFSGFRDMMSLFEAIYKNYPESFRKSIDTISKS